MSLPTTSEYWSVNGISLHQFAWNVTTFGGSPRGFPTLRGDNVIYAYRPGEDFRPKVAESRVISLSMYVVGADNEDDDDPGAYVNNPTTQFVDNWRALQSLFWTPRNEVELTRRWLTSGGLVTATAKAQIAGEMVPVMTGRARATFSVDLLLADPYFYGEELEQEIHMYPGGGDVGPAVEINNPGDSVTSGYGCVVEFEATGASVVLPRLTNLTPSPSVWAQYDGTLSADNSLLLDVRNSIATLQGLDVVTGAIRASGARQWFELYPGDNDVEFSMQSDDGSPVARLVFRPPYV